MSTDTGVIPITAAANIGPYSDIAAAAAAATAADASRCRRKASVTMHKSKYFKLQLPVDRIGVKEYNKTHRNKREWRISIGFPELTTEERFVKRGLCRDRAFELIKKNPNIVQADLYHTLDHEELRLINSKMCNSIYSTSRSSESKILEIKKAVIVTGYKYFRINSPLVYLTTSKWLFDIKAEKDRDLLSEDKLLIYNELEAIIDMNEYAIGNVINYQNYYNSAIDLNPQLNINHRNFYTCMKNRKYDFKSYPMKADTTRRKKKDESKNHDEDEKEFSKSNYLANNNNPFRQLVYLMFLEYIKVAQVEVERVSLYLFEKYRLRSSKKTELPFKTNLLFYYDKIPYATEHKEVIPPFRVKKVFRFLFSKKNLQVEGDGDFQRLATNTMAGCLYNYYPSYKCLGRFRSQASRFRTYMVKLGDDTNLRTVDDIGFNDMSQQMKSYFNHAVSDNKQDVVDYEFDHLFPITKYFRLVQFGERNDIEILKNPERCMRLAFQISKNLCAVTWFFNAVKFNSFIYNIVLEHKDDEIVIKFHCHDGQFRTVSTLIAEYNFDELLKFHDDNPIVSQYWNYQDDEMDLLSSSEKEGKKTHLKLMNRTNEVCTNYKSFISKNATSREDVRLLNRPHRAKKFTNEEKLYEVDPLDPHMVGVEQQQ